MVKKLNRHNGGIAGRVTCSGRPGKIRALTAIELLVVIAILGIAVAIFLPRIGRSKVYADPYDCESNLKQIGLAFRTWEGDYNDFYPMRYFTNADGTMKWADAANAYRYFQVMSNELCNPVILACPKDAKRDNASIPAGFGPIFNGAHISYFIGLDADESTPKVLLSGDRNIINGSQPINGILYVKTNQPASWTPERHENRGNILFSDGHVQTLSATELKSALANTGLATNRLAMP